MPREGLFWLVPCGGPLTVELEKQGTLLKGGVHCGHRKKQRRKTQRQGVELTVASEKATTCQKSAPLMKKRGKEYKMGGTHAEGSALDRPGTRGD